MENYLEANHNRPIKILIINLHSSRNAGDAALALTAIQQLRKNFPNNQITLSMNDPSSHHGEESIVGSFMYWFQSDYGEGVFKPKFVTIFQLGLGSLITVTLFRFFNREIMLFVTKEQKTFLKAYLEADMIVSAPGNFLYSSGKFGFALITALFSMAFAIFAKKPLYLLPQSIGPFRYAWERHFVKWVLSQARIIMVREPVSMAQLISFGVKHPRLYQLSDLAFLFKGAPRQQALQWLSEYGVNPERDKPLMGITTINWADQSPSFSRQQQYETAITEAAYHFIHNIGGKVILFPQVYGPARASDDRVPSRRIAKRLQEVSDHVILIEKPAPPEILKTAYGFMDIFIGTRMHSNIFALSQAVPVLAIAYQYKTHGIMQSLDLGDWVIEIEHSNSEELIQMLDKLWQDRERIREKIKIKVSMLRGQASRAGAFIAEDFYSLNRQL